MRQTTTGGGSVPLAAEPGSIARMTQGWRDHMLATHLRQVALHKAKASGGSNPPAASTAGKIDIYREGHGYRVTATFKGGGEAWAETRRAAERLAASAGRWWRRHQDNYLAQLACVLDPGDRMPMGWTPPRRRV